MRNPLYRPQTQFMRYGIREVVDLAQRLGELDPQFRFIGENIGDPVAKGWDVPEFVQTILTDLIRKNSRQVFGYVHSRGRIEARQWVVEYARRFSPHSRLNYEQVVFANGLGAAISVFYRMLGPGARIIQPNPGYPAHISTERFYAGSESIGYRLDPARRWQPDLEHLEDQVRRHPEITGILLINPNNPTGAVYSGEMLEQVIRLAERYQLILISDEVYFRMVFNGGVFTHLTELALGRVPLVVMRGLSKDVPWPGGRCGWMEFHNVDLDAEFQRFFESIKKPLMLEVCATALPQLALPLIYDHPDYPAWLARNNAEMESNSNMIAEILGHTPGLRVNPIQGAFYMMPLFEPQSLNARQSLPIAHSAVKALIESLLADPATPVDKRFAYYLLAATGICVVPASDFEGPDPGFRVTTLDRDPARRRQTYQNLAQAVTRYLESA